MYYPNELIMKIHLLYSQDLGKKRWHPIQWHSIVSMMVFSTWFECHRLL